MAEKVDQMDPDEKIVEIAIERLRVLALELRNYMKIAHPGTFISKPVNNNSGNSETKKGRILRNHIRS